MTVDWQCCPSCFLRPRCFRYQSFPSCRPTFTNSKTTQTRQEVTTADQIALSREEIKDVVAVVYNRWNIYQKQVSVTDVAYIVSVSLSLYNKSCIYVTLCANIR